MTLAAARHLQFLMLGNGGHVIRSIAGAPEYLEPISHPKTDLKLYNEIPLYMDIAGSDTLAPPMYTHLKYHIIDGVSCQVYYGINIDYISTIVDGKLRLSLPNVMTRNIRYACEKMFKNPHKAIISEGLLLSSDPNCPLLEDMATVEHFLELTAPMHTADVYLTLSIEISPTQYDNLTLLAKEPVSCPI
jgi:hypothetical protein